MRAKILFLLLLITMSACFFQQRKKRYNSSESSIPIIESEYQLDSNRLVYSSILPVSSISIVKGKYQLDTNRILYNSNLGQLIDDLEGAELVEKNTFKEVPLFIRSFLDDLTNTFEIANPEEDWQAGCTPAMRMRKDKAGRLFLENLKLPRRQLIYFGIGDNIAVMRHYQGGVGRSEHILIFKFKNNTIVDFWCGFAYGIITNKTELLNLLKENSYKVMGLNTGIIYF